MFNRKWVFTAACIGMLLFGIGLITLGSVATFLSTKFSLDGASAGTLFSILPVGILFGSLIFGRLGDHFGYKPVLIISCIGMFAGFEGIAFSSSLNFLKASIFIFGVCGGAINGATNALVSDVSLDKKGANLSLLGVFFGIGALGMPLLLGVLESTFAVEQVVAGIGALTLVVGFFLMFIKFPPGKSSTDEKLLVGDSFFKNAFLLLIAFFLFCQSGFEAIINNWTTTYLTVQTSVNASNALYALSLHIVGMIAMRIVIGTLLRNTLPTKIIWLSLVLLLFGTILLHLGVSYPIAVVGLVLLGAGVAAGFPIMLGFVGEQYYQRSGAAFSFVMVIALIGNMLLNYLTGLVIREYGIRHLTTVSYAVIFIMGIFCIFIFKKIRQ